MPTPITQVPQDIREYFGSEEMSAKLRDLRARADIETPRTLPRLMYLLETKEVSVHDFLDYIIRELKFPPEKARALAKEIKEKILEPKRYALSQWGIDLSFLEVANAPSLDAFPPILEAAEGPEKPSFAMPATKPAERTIPLESLSLPTEEKIEAKTPEPEKPYFATPKELAETKPFDATQDKPLIIHEESSFAKATEDKEKRPTLKSFLPSFGFLRSKKQTLPEVKAQIETSSEGKEKKVVHYSEFRTPVSPFGDEGKFIKPAEDTKPFYEPPTPALEQETSNKRQETILPPPLPAAPPAIRPKKFVLSNVEENQKNKTGPKLEGNKVDLRTNEE